MTGETREHRPIETDEPDSPRCEWDGEPWPCEWELTIQRLASVRLLSQLRHPSVSTLEERE